MTVDSELRKIWRRDIRRLEEKLDALILAYARLDLEISTHHPRIGLTRPSREEEDTGPDDVPADLLAVPASGPPR